MEEEKFPCLIRQHKNAFVLFHPGIIAAGFTVEFTLGDIEQAKAFASGGVIGVLYMQMLTKSIDQFFSAVDDKEEMKKKNESGRARKEKRRSSRWNRRSRVFKKSQTSSSEARLRKWPSWRTLDVSLRNISAPTTALDGPSLASFRINLLSFRRRFYTLAMRRLT